MTALTQTQPWQALVRHRDALVGKHLRELFAQDPARFDRFSLQLGDLLFDYSKQRVTAETMSLLVQLAEARNLSDGLKRMAAGERINSTEQRAALHMALRADSGYTVDGADVSRGVRETRDRVCDTAERIRNGQVLGAKGKPIRHVINLGIGGSDLGPRMASRALYRYAHPGLRVDYVANVDPAELGAVLARANADETLFVLSSKTLTTIETLTNARSARAWLATHLGSQAAVGSHFFAVSNNLKGAAEFGIPAERCFELPEWVGGRYSMWSAIGLPLACAIGANGFRALLAGAHQMDEHFLKAPFGQNMPVIMGLLGIWNTDFLGAESLAVLPYSHALGELPLYLQQLEMESNGKRVTREGAPVGCNTSPIVWGSSGTVGQHAFHQLFYQGTRVTPVDFVVPVGGSDPAQQTLVSNALAQSAALMLGKTEDEAYADLKSRGIDEAQARRLAPHMVCPGNQPSTTVMLPDLTPHALGQLIALYEHKVFAQGWIWGINSFDQYGVELGKQMARAVGGSEPGGAAADVSTAGLMRAVAALRARPS